MKERGSTHSFPSLSSFTFSLYPNTLIFFSNLHFTLSPLTPTMEEECLNIGAIDDILNFTDLGDDDDDDHHLDKPRTKRPPLSSPHAAFLEEQEQEQEEELEWISNFPPVDEYVLAGDRGSIDKHQSPISVLENSTSSSNSNNNSNSSSNNSNSFIMSYCGSLRVPVRARNKRCRKRRRSFADIPGQQFWWSQENVKSSRAAIKTTTTIGRKCQHCGAEKTPQWRAGPLGSKTLCNACGVRFKSGRLVPEYRPASSPTFSSLLHSNSHRKIIEMRRQKQWQTAPVKAADKG